MNNEEIIALAIAGIAAWMLLSSRKAAAQPASPAASPQTTGQTYADQLLKTGQQARVVQIDNQALPGQEGWGWSYFTDGTAIDPSGNYYMNGQRIWSPS